MAIKPILFNTEMVRAILDGRKTQTRRVVKQPPIYGEILHDVKGWYYIDGTRNGYSLIPPFAPGDILWVRETWGKLTECNVYPPYEPYHERFIYRADLGDPDHFQARWHPSIHMPKEAARSFLRVNDVQVERLQDITEEDVVAEGAEPLIQCSKEHRTYEPDGTSGDMCWNTNCCTPCYYIDKSYGELFGEIVWDSTIKKTDLPRYGWSANPWVWVITFEHDKKPEGWCE